MNVPADDSLLFKLRIARTSTHGLYALLIAAFSGWQLTRPGGPLVTFWVIQLVPLLIVLPGMLKHRPRSYSWLCFILLPYFVKGVDGVAMPHRAWIDYLMVAVSVLLFITAMLTSRWLRMAINRNLR